MDSCENRIVPAKVMVLCMVALRVATKKGEIDQDTAGRIAEELSRALSRLENAIQPMFTYISSMRRSASEEGMCTNLKFRSVSHFSCYCSLQRGRLLERSVWK